MNLDGIQKAISAHRANRLLADHEARQGTVPIHRIRVDQAVGRVGWTPAPPGIVEAYQVTLDGERGFLYANPMDDYCRYEFYPSRFCQSLGRTHAATPKADRERQETDQDEHKRASAARHAARVEASIRQMTESRARRGYGAMVDANTRTGLPVFDVPETLVVYQRDVVRPDGQGMRVGENERHRLAQKLLRSMDQFESSFGHRPLLSLWRQEDEEVARVAALHQQLIEQTFCMTCGVSLRLAIQDGVATLDFRDPDELKTITLLVFPLAPTSVEIEEGDQRYSLDALRLEAVRPLKVEEGAGLRVQRLSDARDAKLWPLAELIAESVRFAPGISRDDVAPIDNTLFLLPDPGHLGELRSWLLDQLDDVGIDPVALRAQVAALCPAPAHQPAALSLEYHA